MEYKYIILEDHNGLTSLERVEGISKELYYLSRPEMVREEGDISNYLFGWVKHPELDKYALEVIMDFRMRAHINNNLDNLISLLDNVSEQEVNNLVNYVNSVDEFEFGTIIPSTSNLRDRLYMSDNGWFPEVYEFI